MSTAPTGDGAIGEDVGTMSHGAGAAGPIFLRDVLPPRYRLPDEAPTILASVTGQARLKAFDTEAGKSVFIKVAEDGMAIPKEAEVLTRLDHPAIVRLKHWGRGGGAAFLVLDLVDAPDLEIVLRRHGGRLAADQIRRLLAALCPGVEAIHAAGCLHRDLKPANILVPDIAAPIIADFGAAVPMDQAGIDAESWLSQGYAAPEQYRADQGEGPWTDLYGLAAVAYRALTGAPPPSAPARLGGAWMMPAASAVGDDNMNLARAIDHALALEPDHRPRSVAAWAATLGVASTEPGTPPISTPQADAAAGGDGVGRIGIADNAADDGIAPTVRVRRLGGDRAIADVPAPPSAAGTPPSRRRRGRWWWAAFALLGLVAIAGIWVGRPFYERFIKSDWIVAHDGGGDTTTIGEAIRRARDGASIHVRAGTYAETVVLNRPLRLAAAPGERPVIAPSDGPCLVARGEGATLTGFELRGAGQPSDRGSDTEAVVAMPCITISSGTIHLEDSLIAAPAGPAIVVRDGARPLIQGNTIVETPGVSIIVRSGAEPTFLDNSVEESGSVVFGEGARGVFQNNKILGSRASGLQILTGADPRVSANTIEASAEAGVFVYDRGRGRLEDNRILGSTYSGIVISGGGAPALIANTIAASGEHGIIVLDNSGGTIDRNIIKDNKGNGLVLSEQAQVELGTNQLEGNTPPQLVDARTR